MCFVEGCGDALYGDKSRARLDTPWYTRKTGRMAGLVSAATLAIARCDDGDQGRLVASQARNRPVKQYEVGTRVHSTRDDVIVGEK